jgi:hypothetical protein
VLFAGTCCKHNFADEGKPVDLRLTGESGWACSYGLSHTGVMHSSTQRWPDHDVGVLAGTVQCRGWVAGPLPGVCCAVLPWCMRRWVGDLHVLDRVADRVCGCVCTFARTSAAACADCRAADTVGWCCCFLQNSSVRWLIEASCLARHAAWPCCLAHARLCVNWRPPCCRWRFLSC